MPATTKQEQRQYVQTMLRELRDMADGNRDQVLAYLIEMAYVEVSDLIRSSYADVKPRAARSGA